MKLWMVVGTLLVVILVWIAVLWGQGRVGNGYVMVGQGLEVADKQVLQQMVTRGREAAGFFRPWVVLVVHEGVREPTYPLFMVDINKTDGIPLTGCNKPRVYGARGVSVITLDLDNNKIITARGEEKAEEALNGFITNCLTYALASGDVGTGYKAVGEAVNGVRRNTLVWRAQ